MDALLAAIEWMRDVDGPAVLHVRTRKGCGYAPAEADPYGWHATKPFEVETGRRTSGSGNGPPSWTEAFADALGRIADRDPRVVAITAAMPDGTGLDRFARRHPDRVYDVGIAEQHAVTFAAGLATEGVRPVCAIYSTFLQRAFDQIVHDVALQQLPVIFALDRAGLVGADGPTHHGALDLAYLRMIPNLVIAAPRDENELQHLLATAVESELPFAIRFPRGSARGVALDPDPKPLPIGRGVLLRDGSDVALVGIGKTVGEIEKAAEQLAAHGVSAGVIDARFAKPLDAALLESSAQACGLLVTVEDHAVHGGFGSAVRELLGERAPGARILSLGLADHFVDHGDVAQQWRDAGIDAESIVRRTLEALATFRPRSAPRWREQRGRPGPGRNGLSVKSRALGMIDLGSSRAAREGRLSAEVLDAYAQCARVTRQSGSSFASAFWMLPRAKRRAVHAIYAFCRLADDIADDPAVGGDRTRLLARWRAELESAYRGKSAHPVGIALADAIQRFQLPEREFADLLRGVESDLRDEVMETWEDLERYCYRVASTVGLLVVRVLGYRNPRSLEYARSLGIAVQLTNVLRDVGEDAAAGRIYLAREDLDAPGRGGRRPARAAHDARSAAAAGVLRRARAQLLRAGGPRPAG